ncbi:hypothetical protein NDU88_007028 [Pleurodeles waltl]|uniref:Myb/SANT-like DNA-binding domain-containing protein n=1 Tax=Pleurodeles waltl TaxID=8319 RepID=A0AAV7N5U7_PLEWA|nr:hypothetical protein NDU88_007028 [Pleurodeles waltl]
MAAATGERAPAFTSDELDKLVDGVLPQYALLYGPPDQQVSAHQKVDIWRPIAKDVRALGVHNRRGTHCRKRWEDICRGTRKTAESLLGMASQRRRGASRTLTPLMSRILAVAYPDLDGRVRTSRQTQGGGGELASEHEGAATHMAPVGHAIDTEVTSDTEGEGSSTTGTRGDVSDTNTSSEGSSLAVAATSVPPATTGAAATQRTSPTLPAAPQPSLRARSPKKAGISFAPGTSGPAPVTPAALSEEVIDLLQTIIVGQSTLLNAIQGVEREVHRSNAFLEGIHSGQAAHQRSFNALASALTAAIVPIHRPAAWGQPAHPLGREPGRQRAGARRLTRVPPRSVVVGRHLPQHQGEARARKPHRRRARAAGRRSQPAGARTRRAPPVHTGCDGGHPWAQDSITGGASNRTVGGRLSRESWPGLAPLKDRTSTAEQGPAVQKGTAEQGPAVQKGTAELGPTVQKGTAEQGPAVQKGTAEQGPAVKTGTAEQGPPCRKAPLNRAPP